MTTQFYERNGILHEAYILLNGESFPDIDITASGKTISVPVKEIFFVRTRFEEPRALVLIVNMNFLQTIEMSMSKIGVSIMDLRVSPKILRRYLDYVNTQFKTSIKN